MLGETVILIPVPEVEKAVGRWRGLYDTSAQAGLPAHITLLYPFLSAYEVTATVVAKLAKLLRNADPIPFELDSVARFPKVLYLAPNPADPFRELTNAIWRLFPEHPPYGGQFTGVIPHLTVAESDDEGLLVEIRRAIEPALPISATVGQAWLMGLRDDRWDLLRRFDLGKPEVPSP